VVAVKTYRGVRSGKAVGDKSKDGEILNISLGLPGVSGLYTTGKMVKGDDYLTFFPYTRMTYQDMTDDSQKDAYVTSQWVSAVRPNDFAEVNWGRATAENLTVDSRQWSLHARAVIGDDGWQGNNRVLPGGAVYELKSENTIIGLATWQTVMLGNERNRLATGLSDTNFTVAGAEAAHNLYVEEAKATLDGLEVYQWVNGDPNATNAWSNNGKRVKVEPGVSLSPLGLRTKASGDAKYQINGDSTKNRTLDVLGEAVNEKTYFKVFADTAGKIYVAKSIGNVDAIKSVNGLNLSVDGVAVTMVLDKHIGADSVESVLTGEAKMLNDRTLLITNFVRALERNAGNDPSASWASDGRWYNEAFDGIYVVRQQTSLRVGFSGVKTLALDPNLTPVSNGKADSFKKAFVSQYKAEPSSSTAAGSNPGYLANFKGQDIRLMNMGDIFSSKKFYIPNALVKDNN